MLKKGEPKSAAEDKKLQKFAEMFQKKFTGYF